MPTKMQIIEAQLQALEEIAWHWHAMSEHERRTILTQCVDTLRSVYPRTEPNNIEGEGEEND